MICNICKKEIPSNRGLSNHVIRVHKMSVKQYYDTYLKTEDEGYCLYCGKPVIFLNITKGYRKYCSRTCCNKSEEHQQKMQNTINLKYGGLGTASEIINNKIKNTNQERYGAENLYASEYGKNKIKQTNLKRRGVEYAVQSPIVKNKIKQTSLDRYNTTNPANSREGRLKAARTRRANDNDSSWEDFLENQLKLLNIQYEKRYNKDPRYPFMCDFYLPETDTFIEINGYWTHGGHFFDENSEEDLKILEKWKEKAKDGHKQYKNAINVWTIKDPQKHTIAINNKLNYIVLWKYNDIIEFINKIS